MLLRLRNPILLTRTRSFSIAKTNHYNVTVFGAAGGIGQPLSLLLKINPLVTKLHLYDLATHTPGVGVDLSHIETPSKVKSFKDPSVVCDAIKGTDLVIITAEASRQKVVPGVTREDLFKKNAVMVRTVMESIAESEPTALIAIITNPINSVVPVACETMKKAGKLDPRRIFGVCTLDVVRANVFVAEAKGLSPSDVNVPIVGGHSDITIIPLLSKVTPETCFTKEEVKYLTAKIQQAGPTVVKAKMGGGAATLSMAYAAARFANSLLKGLNGEKNVIESAYVMSDVTEAAYFTTPLLLGKRGVEKNLGIGKVDSFERDLLLRALPEIKKGIAMGITFVNQI